MKHPLYAGHCDHGRDAEGVQARSPLGAKGEAARRFPARQCGAECNATTDEAAEVTALQAWEQREEWAGGSGRVAARAGAGKRVRCNAEAVAPGTATETTHRPGAFGGGGRPWRGSSQRRLREHPAMTLPSLNCRAGSVQHAGANAHQDRLVSRTKPSGAGETRVSSSHFHCLVSRFILESMVLGVTGKS